jgi:hypothetical protein
VVSVVSVEKGNTTHGHKHNTHTHHTPAQLAPCLLDLSAAALHPEVEPAAAGEAKPLLRCLSALLRRHALLLPDLTLELLARVMAGSQADRCGRAAACLLCARRCVFAARAGRVLVSPGWLADGAGLCGHARRAAAAASA